MSEPEINREELRALLRERFGFEQFRPGQAEAIEQLLRYRCILCIQPTGYGKSLIYQLPSLLFEGITLVISPLLALMRDQVQQLNERFNIPAASINSDQTPQENEAAMTAARMQRLRILFVAPEKLDNLEMIAFLSSLDVALIVVDEAHCISTWGHDFRPSYRQIVEAVRIFAGKNPRLHILGLTATASRRTEEDIAAQLGGADGRAFPVQRMPMDRPNIRLSVLPVAGMAEKLSQLAILLRQLEGSGILYCATREHTEIAADYLSQEGLDVAAYHAGMQPERKRELQAAFMGGKHKAIAATNALGMGIDKNDIRFIIHVDVPGSITAYYQEVGRAGRDGLPAEGILLFDVEDRRVQDYFIRSAQPTSADFQNILQTIDGAGQGEAPNLALVKIRSGLHPTRVQVILAELIEQGFVEKRLVQRRQVYVTTGKDAAPDLARYDRQYAVRTQELQAMLDYGEGGVACLMQALRQALGDGDAPRCGRCSLCKGLAFDHAAVTAESAGSWLQRHEIAIPAARRPAMSAGVAVLDRERHRPSFGQFMRHRAAASGDGELGRELQARIGQVVSKLCRDYDFGAVIVVPSRTWRQREATAAKVAEQLGVRAFSDLLFWKDEPATRQGELLNNDQRRHNVSGKMGLRGPLIRPGSPAPVKAILLLDDYTGSGATLKEAARALRSDGGFTAEIVPLTVAKVRWRIGARGMI